MWGHKLQDREIEMGLMEAIVKICPCTSETPHEDFQMLEHHFYDGSIELLPALCPENELLSSELYQKYRPILKTLESNENWSNYACYAGMIAEIKPGLYFYSFGDIDEAGENNFYLKSELKPILETLISDWSTVGPDWREFLKSIGVSDYPKGYQPGSMVDHKEFFPKLDEEGLTVGISFNMESSELRELLARL
jgi:hypothetical protein